MRSSEFNKLVTLQKKSVTRDAMGGEVVTWADQAQVWAAIEPLAARELFAAQQVHPELTTRIRIRHRSDVAAEWRVKYGTRIFAIVGPPIDRALKNEELHLNCAEGVIEA